MTRTNARFRYTIAACVLPWLALLLVLIGCSPPGTDATASDTTTPGATAPDATTSHTPGATTAVPAIQIHTPVVYLMPDTGAAYLEIVNSGAEEDRLLAVTTPAAQQAELHESIDDGGVMRMVPHADGIAIPAGETVTLAPGGKHIMLMALHAETAQQERISLVLRFARAGEITVEAPLTALGAAAEEDHGHHH